MRFHIVDDHIIVQSYPSGGSTPVPPPEGETIIIELVGQSNNVARGVASAPDEVTVPAGCAQYVPNTDSLIALADPIGMVGDLSRATTRSQAPMLAKRLKELTGKDIIIVASAQGNTNTTQWLNKAGSQYTNALSRWNAVNAYCVTNNIDVVGRYIYWLLGENNAAAGDSIDTHVSELNEIVDNFMTDFTGCEKVFAARIGYLGVPATNAQAEPIMNAQKRMNFSKDSYILATNIPATFTAANGRAKSGDEVHYTLKGLNETADDVAEAIHNWRENNAKHTEVLTETVVSLQDPVDYFDDIYLFRSLTTGEDIPNYNEMFGRNNLTLAAGSPNKEGTGGIVVSSQTTLTPDTVRTLANTHDWTIEVTFRMTDDTSIMLMNGRSTGNWQDDWLWANTTTSIQIKGNTVNSNTLTLTGANFNQVTNMACVWTASDNTLRTYINGSLANTKTDWAYTSMQLQAFLRGYQNSPIIPFTGVMERIRVVKRALSAYEFDRSPNITTTNFSWQFDFTNSLDELNGQVSAAGRNFAGTLTSPTYDADGVVFDENFYVRLGQQVEMEDFTVEYRLKHDTDSGFGYITGPVATMAGAAGGLANRIVHQSTTNLVYFNGLGGGNITWSLPAHTWSSFHTYKITRNYGTGIAELFVDGVSKGTKTVVGIYQVKTIGGGHSTQANLFRGTIDWMKIQNFL